MTEKKWPIKIWSNLGGVYVLACRRFGSLLPRPSLYMRTCDDRRLLLTPSLPQPVRFPGSKVHTYTLANSMFDGPITNLLLILSILMEVLPGTHAAGGGGGGEP